MINILETTELFRIGQREGFFFTLRAPLSRTVTVSKSYGKKRYYFRISWLSKNYKFGTEIEATPEQKSPTMFKNYFISSWRNLTKDKAYTVFNILGLAIGMAVALIIGLWVQYQFSYDRFLPDYGQAHRIMTKYSRNGEAGAGTANCLPLAGVLKKEIPEIKYV